MLTKENLTLEYTAAKNNTGTQINAVKCSNLRTETQAVSRLPLIILLFESFIPNGVFSDIRKSLADIRNFSMLREIVIIKTESGSVIGRNCNFAEIWFIRTRDNTTISIIITDAAGSV